MKATLSRAFWLGLAQGALYGSVLSALHVGHNRLESWLDSLLVLAWMCGLYGGLSAAVFLATAVAFLLVRRPTASADSTTTAARRCSIAGFLIFTVGFWELALLYGLTYDQTLFWEPATAVGMAAYLVLAALLITAGCALVVFLVVVAVDALVARAPARRVVLVTALLALGIHVALPTAFHWPGRSPGPSYGDRSGGGATTLSAVDVDRIDTGTKVVVIGLDGLDPSVLEHFLAEGRLPNFSALRERGVHGSLSTIPDSNSAVIWASIYSGKTPREHGVLDFYRIRLPLVGQGLFPVHRTFFKELADGLASLGLASFEFVQRRDLRSFPYWEIADHFGDSIGVVDGYLYSFPAGVPETPDGYFLSYGLDSFVRLLAEHRAEARDLPLYLQPVDVLPPRELPTAPDFDWQATTLLRLLDRREQPELINLYAHEPDAVQHAHWKSFEPEKYFTAAEKSDFEVDPEGPIAEMYGHFDRFLGQLVADIDDQTAVLVVSDHGHSPTLVHRLDTQHRHGLPGAMLLFGGPFRDGYAVSGADIYDLFPTVLYLLGLPVPEDAAGRVLEEALDPEFLNRFPVRTIPSYQGLWLPAIRNVGQNRELEQIEVEKLKSMGYL